MVNTLITWIPQGLKLWFYDVKILSYFKTDIKTAGNRNKQKNNRSKEENIFFVYFSDCVPN